MKRKLHEILFLISTLAVSITAAIGFSYAAYVYNNLYDNIVDYNTGSFSEYFAAGNGTSASPYTLTNADHFRALQKLNVLGVFSESTHFRVTQSFTWSGDDLQPIGTEDNPFISQFDGYGNTITALVVNGAHTNDIGLFGYVGMQSVIKNLILNRPLIKVTSEGNSNALRTTNPLAATLTSEGASLGLTLSGDRKYFTITNNKTTVTGTDGQTHDVTYTSLDNTLVEWNAGQNRFNVKTPPNAETGKFYTTQITATVYAKLDNMVIAHTLERWQINVNPNGTVNVKDSNNEAGHWKTIYAAADEGTGPHETYVGFFIGHLDGAASHLGLYGTTANNQTNNGKIEIYGRPARSYTTLIGRNFMDNLRDDANGNLRSEFVDIGGMNINSDRSFPSVNESTSVANFFSDSNANGTPKKAIDISTEAGFDAGQRAFMRLNPSSKTVDGTNQVVFRYNHQYQEIDEPTVNEYANTYYINEGLAAYTGGSPAFLRSGPRYHAGANGFWVYLSSAFLRNFIMKEKNYEAVFRIRYTAKGSVNNKFQILYNFYNPGAGLFGRYHSEDYFMDLAASTDDYGDPLYKPNDFPVVQALPPGTSPIPANPIFEHEINFSLSGNVFDGLWGSGSSNPVFFLGAGQNGRQLSPNFENNKINKAYFNVDTPSTFELNIITIDMIISSLDSNMGRQTQYVDYINNTPTFNTGTGVWSSWNTFSNTRIHFNVTDAIIGTNNSAKYRFYRSRDTITAYYTVSNGAWNPAYNPDYRRATINSGY